ncbi:MAG: DUF1127 domain-containing protein [Rhodospirillales bacterium]|nr:DUF1127 domain-containing protein [Rhodospirillales bacterium]
MKLLVPGSINATCTSNNKFSFKSLLLVCRHILVTWQKRSQDRIHLKTLDAHLLKNTGLTRDEVVLEVSKPFWRS